MVDGEQVALHRRSGALTSGGGSHDGVRYKTKTPLTDCDRKIDQEHVISENLLKRFGRRKFMVEGVLWIPEELCENS